ncbi:hypothetical protein [Polyangium mundeleinium]|uniref:Uncharacterized protein n=1 Tax=Polyangium mundeleinium TaxID=2995306 RepID=A0ABT5EP00_9BACT|nr:hypothetical protein [Polyangium mundeleinium]MDC0742451.1 hypothetical protein [Polyangium mundeleinium]
MKNRVFFPQVALDEWLVEDRVDLRNDELTIKNEGRKYRIIEAIRVMSEVSGSPDSHELLGKVKSKAFLAELGAEILETSMILGDNAYDVVPGFVGAPIGTFADHQRVGPPSQTRNLTTDEDLLAAFLATKL